MFTQQDHSMEKMTAVWLLPIVAAEVAAVSGALLVPHLSPSEALIVLILSYGLWAFSVPLAMSILVILLLRLALHKLPERDMAGLDGLRLGRLARPRSGWCSLVATRLASSLLRGYPMSARSPSVWASSAARSCGAMALGGFYSRY